MSWFSSKAQANLDEITAFQRELISFKEICFTDLPKIIKTACDMYDSATKRAQSAEKIAKDYEQLYTSVKKLETEVSHRISSLKTELASTPKELEEEYVDKDGKKQVKKKPNPQYAQLESMISSENSRLFEIRELAFRVSNDLSYTSRMASELYTYAYAIKDAIPEIERSAREMTDKAERADYALSRDIEALERYVSFTFSV